MIAKVNLPPDSAASRRLRAELSSTWWTEAKVMEVLGIKQQELQSLRAQRRLVCAWHAPEQAYLYPPFQFQDSRVAPQIESLMNCLKDIQGASGWSEIEWFYGCHSLLDGKAPAEAFINEPDRVLAVAIREFIDERDSNW